MALCTQPALMEHYVQFFQHLCYVALQGPNASKSEQVMCSVVLTLHD